MDKSPNAFRTISEVAEELGLPQHVLRFWETRFPQIRPLKRGGGRRYYRPDDVDLLKGIRHLLYGEGYTIRGVQRIFKAEGVRSIQAIGRGERIVPPAPTAHDDEFEHAGAQATSEDVTPAARDRAGLSQDALQRLHRAYDELAECDRVLSTLSNASSGPTSE